MGSRDVIDDVIILSTIGHFLFVGNCHHDLDLWRSRDVIEDVIIRSAIGHFLLVGNRYQASISKLF